MSRPACSSTKYKSYQSFRFPADPVLRRSWVVAVKRLKVDDRRKLWEPSKYDCLCSDHFAPSDFRPTKTRQLYSAAVPSIFSFTEKTASASTSRTLRYVESYGQVPISVTEGPSTSTSITSPEVEERLHRAQKDLRNARKREKRLRDTVASLHEKIAEDDGITKSLLEKLEAYQGEFTPGNYYIHIRVKLVEPFFNYSLIIFEKLPIYQFHESRLRFHNSRSLLKNQKFKNESGSTGQLAEPNSHILKISQISG